MISKEGFLIKVNFMTPRTGFLGGTRAWLYYSNAENVCRPIFFFKSSLLLSREHTD